MYHLGEEPPVPHFENYDMRNISTPVDAEMLNDLLKKTHYDPKETEFLVDGFRNGFCIGYEGPENRKDFSENIPITPGVGSKLELWNKIMKEVKLKRYLGPWRKNEIPFENFVQSPVGLVPKDENQTRLIFHLSYTFKNGNESINYWTPREMFGEVQGHRPRNKKLPPIVETNTSDKET